MNVKAALGAVEHQPTELALDLLSPHHLMRRGCCDSIKEQARS
jgi:hypothetical protein